MKPILFCHFFCVSFKMNFLRAIIVSRPRTFISNQLYMLWQNVLCAMTVVVSDALSCFSSPYVSDARCLKALRMEKKYDQNNFFV